LAAFFAAFFFAMIVGILIILNGFSHYLAKYIVFYISPN